MLDVAHSWALGTHSTYQSKIRAIRRFERAHSVPILQATPIVRPPHGPDIPLMWAQEHYATLEGRRRDEREDKATTSFGTVRALRSAASHFYGLDMINAHPCNTYLDKQKRLIHNPVRWTDGYNFTLFSKGLSTRMGTSVKPSTALLARHVAYLDADLNKRFLAAISPALRLELARAGLLNLTLWLGWLRSKEAFSVAGKDLTIVLPGNGQEVDLPALIGAILM
jgi:hypothetical protein